MPPDARTGRPTAARRARGFAVAMLVSALPLSAQATLSATIIGPPGNPIRDGTPGFTITASGFQASDLPLQITLQIATQADFGGTLLADTTVSGVTTATIVVPRLLPERVTIWWRARVRTAQGALAITNAEGPRSTSLWLTLITPNNPNGSTVDTKRPTFLWSSAGVRPPVQPWSYHWFITRSRDAFPVFNSTLFWPDTVFPSPIELESNSPYRWAVVAHLSTGDSVRVQSFASFVILDPNAPVATLLYQSFPNPFPNARLQATCIWFDLARQSQVRLDVLDLRGNFVAKILPGRGLGPIFPPGRYGRAAVGSDSGCDDRLTWDGRDDSGRMVPAGVYLIRFQGDGKRITKPVVWRGR